jgi:arabinofuranosyltransferase
VPPTASGCPTPPRPSCAHPDARFLYAGTFILEYGWWLILLAGGAGVVVAAWRRHRPTLAGAVAAGVLAASFGFYTFVVGGDHFEFRVYHHLVPLGWWASCVLLSWLGLRAGPAALVLALQLLVSLPIPWAHWAHVRAIQAEPADAPPEVPVAADLPWLPYAPLFDRWQTVLSRCALCVRHHEHVEFARTQLATYPQLQGIGWKVPAEDADVPIHRCGSVGVAGWRLSAITIFDAFGLNDAVIAHNPRLRSNRLVAHRRQPPNGYTECLRPNVRVEQGLLIVEPREPPLTPADVRACEDKFWRKLGLPTPWR